MLLSCNVQCCYFCFANYHCWLLYHLFYPLSWPQILDYCLFSLYWSCAALNWQLLHCLLVVTLTWPSVHCLLSLPQSKELLFLSNTSLPVSSSVGPATITVPAALSKQTIPALYVEIFYQLPDFSACCFCSTGYNYHLYHHFWDRCHRLHYFTYSNSCLVIVVVRCLHLIMLPVLVVLFLLPRLLLCLLLFVTIPDSAMQVASSICATGFNMLANPSVFSFFFMFYLISPVC